MVNDPITVRESLSARPADVRDEPLVIVVDDDASVRDSIQNLMSSAGMECMTFASPAELLSASVVERPGCIILDVRMPGSSGLEFQRHLASLGTLKPIVFLTGFGDIPMSVEAMKAGAIDFLTKPFRDQTLLDAVIAGVNQDKLFRANARIVSLCVTKINKLTLRERQILREVVRGRLNKQIAFDLGISEVTVKLHRSNLMRKVEAASVGDLIRMWENLPLPVRELCASEKREDPVQI